MMLSETSCLFKLPPLNAGAVMHGALLVDERNCQNSISLHSKPNMIGVSLPMMFGVGDGAAASLRSAVGKLRERFAER